MHGSSSKVSFDCKKLYRLWNKTFDNLYVIDGQGLPQ